MKLDNKGWSLPELLIGIAIIIVFLLISVFYSLRFNRMLEKNSSNNMSLSEEINEDYYRLKTNDIMDAAYRYIKNEDVELQNGVNTRISLATLINKGYIGRINDSKTNSACIGYVIVTEDPSKITDIKAYLKCDNYVSKGYDN